MTKKEYKKQYESTDKYKAQRRVYMKEYYKRTGRFKGVNIIRNNPNYQRDYLRSLRLAVIEALGGKCVRCEFNDIRALQIDHINGGGNKERKEKGFSKNFHSHVLDCIVRKEIKYQLLCANCNWIKRVENNECKH